MKSQWVEVDSGCNMLCLLSQLERRNGLSVIFLGILYPKIHIYNGARLCASL